MVRPAVVVTADRVLRGAPNVIGVVPLTSTVRSSGAEVTIEPDEHNGLSTLSSAQCQHVRSVAVARAGTRLGNVGPATLRQIRDVLAVIIDM